MIISVGYRVKSQNGVIFRKWANRILKVIGSYTKALDLLDDYDHKSLTKPTGHKNHKKITYENCINIIKKLRFNEESDIFAIERDKGLKSIISDIFQTYDGKDVYMSVEEKATKYFVYDSQVSCFY